jgi:uncharacterized protein
MESAIYTLLKEKKTEELITEIIKNKDLLYFVDSKGVSLLSLSFYFRNKELGDFILSHRKPKDIYEAVTSGTTDVVVQLLKSNAELLNAHSPDGFTPLGLASYFGRTEIVALLIENGADPNIPASNSMRVAPIHSSVSANSYEITKLLLDHGADPNSKQQNNFTALHSAAHSRNAKMVSLLLEHGADRNVKTDDGKTPRDMAKEVNTDEVVRLLES